MELGKSGAVGFGGLEVGRDFAEAVRDDHPSATSGPPFAAK